MHLSMAVAAAGNHNPLLVTLLKTSLGPEYNILGSGVGFQTLHDTIRSQTEESVTTSNSVDVESCRSTRAWRVLWPLARAL